MTKELKLYDVWWRSIQSARFCIWNNQIPGVVCTWSLLMPTPPSRWTIRIQNWVPDVGSLHREKAWSWNWKAHSATCGHPLSLPSWKTEVISPGLPTSGPSKLECVTGGKKLPSAPRTEAMVLLCRCLAILSNLGTNSLLKLYYYTLCVSSKLPQILWETR